MSKTSPYHLGRHGEELAAQFLEMCGYHCLGRRYRKWDGEIDLIVRRGPLLVFLEVKARRSNRCGRPEEAVTPQKLGRLRRVALSFLQENPVAGIVEYRFDVIAVELLGDGRGCHLRHYAGVG
ncbi:MAG: YraN family protein [bacterium]